MVAKKSFYRFLVTDWKKVEKTFDTLALSKSSTEVPSLNDIVYTIKNADRDIPLWPATQKWSRQAASINYS